MFNYIYSILEVTEVTNIKFAGTELAGTKQECTDLDDPEQAGSQLPSTEMAGTKFALHGRGGNKNGGTEMKQNHIYYTKRKISKPQQTDITSNLAQCFSS